MEYRFLLDLAIILLSTKLLGLATKRMHMPQVVGALLAGLLLGPAVLGVLEETAFVQSVAEIGVIVLMFCAGLETDVQELKKCGKAAFVIAVLGVLVPLAGGFLVGWVFNRPGRIDSDASCSLFLQNMFIGVVLTATSVSITVETLKELGKLQSKSGNAILGAAIIDDVLGIIALTIITSAADSSVKMSTILIKILLFFVFSGVAGFAFFKFYDWWSRRTRLLHRHAIVAFVFCLLMAYCAEEFFGVADITGAYIAGVIISMTQTTQYLSSRFDTLSYLMLSPVFFASIGLKVNLPAMTPSIVLFAVVLVVIAVITKVIGCGFGAKLCGYRTCTCVQIGVGMVSRGEVALIVASQGMRVGLIGANFLGPVVIVVIVTTIVTPILQKIVYNNSPKPEIVHNGLSDNYQELREIRDRAN
ncbi:cation:proton antiporter [Cuneatibacter sp. NSJ-177]|uniref:cation:proton antiporter n=1 Tax=Cuneatibacter sp. NSJ-177 TaxID=2931401 RepID=UPI001FD085D6|nr:cation:proton antiporter [Cuneatibacter sp. NSJ-177]MCJ7835326.1 cation:proton antiporter [Cuneatibacter sp. NSJ-177]